MKSQELALRWAKQTHPKGRANNAYFTGRDFYHYGTRIGLILPAVDQSPVALVSRHQYSSGTSKVQGELAHAASDGAGMRVFRVDKCGEDHAGNVRDYRERIAEAEDAMTRARNKDAHAEGLERLRSELGAYQAAFGAAANG